MTSCIINNGESTIHKMMTLQQIMEYRNKLCRAAKSALRNNNADHIIYYTEIRNRKDEIQKANFYDCLIKMDDKTFQKCTKKYHGFIGAVHR